MRRFALILVPLAFAAFACLAGRRTPPPPEVGAAAEPTCAEAPAGVLSSAEDAPSARETPADVQRFEPLEPEPNALVVQLTRGASEEPLAGAEVWLLEHDDFEWIRERTRDGDTLEDVEALARAQGRRVECDEKGRVQLRVPERTFFLCARAGELFGAAQYSSGDAPESTLPLFPDHACRVRVLSEAGRPLAGVPVVFGTAGEVHWRARTDPAGVVLVPNLAWLVREFVRDGAAWFVRVDEVREHPAARRFEAADEVPSELEFVLPEAVELRLHLQTSDGTRLPIDGSVGLYLVHGPGNRAGLRPDEAFHAECPLKAGEALVARVERGSWVEVGVELDGHFEFAELVRVPDAGRAELVLTLPERAQVLLFRATDAAGAPFANRKLEWSTFASEPSGCSIVDDNVHPLVTDELGRGALALERHTLEEREAARVSRGVLRLHDGATQFESAPIDLDVLGASRVRDLGSLPLVASLPLVRGRLLDDTGAPIAHASVSIYHVDLVEGEEVLHSLPGVEDQSTGADGRFAFLGAGPGGRLRLSIDRNGYRQPDGEDDPECEQGANTELEIRLVRTGKLRVSVLADAPIDAGYSWLLSGPGGRQRESVCPSNSPGELTSEFWELVPGSYELELVREDAGEPPLATFTEVVIQPGARTLDPRLLRVPLHVPGNARAARTHVDRAEPRSVHLRVVDEQGLAIESGTLVTWGGCSWSRDTFHGGRIEMREDHAGDTLGLWAPGRCYTELKCPERDATIVLAPAPRVRVHLAVPAGLRGVRLQADLNPQDEASGMHWLPDFASGTEFDERGEIVLECPGPCRLALAVYCGESALETEEPLLVEVAAQPLEQRCELAVSAAEWAAFARSLR